MLRLASGESMCPWLAQLTRTEGPDTQRCWRAAHLKDEVLGDHRQVDVCLAHHACSGVERVVRVLLAERGWCHELVGKQPMSKSLPPPRTAAAPVPCLGSTAERLLGYKA